MPAPVLDADVAATRAQVLRGRLVALGPSFLKFAVVGAGSILIDFLLFNLFNATFGVEALASKALSTTLTVTFFGYPLSRWWVFADRSGGQMHREFVAFLLLTAAGLGIAEAVLAFSYYALGLHSRLANNISANVVGNALATVFRFWAYRNWVFRHPPAVDVAAPPAAPAGDLPGLAD